MWNELARGGLNVHWGYALAGITLFGLGLTLGALDLARPDAAKAQTPAGEIVVMAHYMPIGEKVNPNLAKYEPESGVYLGAYIDLDPNLPASFRDQNNRPRKRPKDFEQRVGKSHAMYFFYLGYGKPAPIDYLRYVASQDKYIQIALEPNAGLDAVREDEYLLQLAEDLRDSGAKIFLRFASEMNGDWVAYHGDPKKYIEKWRLVTRVMRDRAPNVAMVWCPYAVPVGNVLDYYPGDEYVDWVGVNLYNVTHFNQSPLSPAKNIGPRDLLRPIYDMFADRKPIMICEYATTHFSALENQSFPYFAANNIRELYQSLGTEFPRVKAIYYFSSNNLMLAHRRNNNYSLLDHPIVLETYRRVIADERFLGAPQTSSLAEKEPITSVLQDGKTLPTRARLIAWVNGSSRVSFVRFSLNGKPVRTATESRDWTFTLNPRAVQPGPIRLDVEAFDDRGVKVASKRYNLTLQPMPR